MKPAVVVVLAWINIACAFVTPPLRPLWMERHGIPLHSTSTTPTLPDGWVTLPVNPAAGELSRTIPFSPSSVQDLQRMKKVLRQAEDDKCSHDACVVIIPSWRHHLVQYDRLSAALEALDIPTAVHPLPDGLWAFLLRRLQGHALRQAVRNGFLKKAIENALILPFSHLDSALRAHTGHHPGRRMAVLASDDSAWLVRAFINSRSQEWHTEVPLETAVFVGEYHKSTVGGLALDVYPQRLKFKHESKGSDGLEHRRIRFYGLHGRKGGHVTQDGDMDNLETSISCVSFEEDTESCILQEYEPENRDWSSLMGSTALISLWVPRVLRC